MTIDTKSLETFYTQTDEKGVFQSKDLQVYIDEAGKPQKKGRAAIIKVSIHFDEEGNANTFPHQNGDLGILVVDADGRTGFLNLFGTLPAEVMDNYIESLNNDESVPVIVYKDGKCRALEAKDFR